MVFPGLNENWIHVNRSKIFHSLVGKICDHEIGIKWNTIDCVVESWKHECIFKSYHTQTNLYIREN